MPDTERHSPQTPSGRRQYRIEGVIGKGAFGTVYKAEYLGEEGFTREVAIKFLNPDRQGFNEFAQRLRDEARLLGLLRHRAIVHVDGLVFLDSRWTVVMEYIGGADLQKILTQGSMPIGPALEVVGEVAGALNVAYWTRLRSGEPLHLLHRDIKPSNILITPAGEAKVVDFGVARAEFTARESDTDGTRFGSLGYMSPERLEFVDGPEGDVYALGAVLYELLAGRPLGRTSVHPARHAKRVNEAMQALHREKPALSTALKGFLSNMLDYEPSRRPTAREVETRCREFRGGESSIWLREWAEASVPPFVKKITPDHLSRTVLREGQPAATAPSPTAAAPQPVDALPSRFTPEPENEDLITRYDLLFEEGASPEDLLLPPDETEKPPPQRPLIPPTPGSDRHPTLVVPDDFPPSVDEDPNPTPPTFGNRREDHPSRSHLDRGMPFGSDYTAPSQQAPGGRSPLMPPRKEFYQARDPWTTMRPVLVAIIAVFTLPILGTLLMWMLWLSSC